MRIKKGSKLEKIVMILAGIITGFINGIFGGGGGMIIVPILTFLLSKKNKIAHATAILIILPMTIVSAIFYLVFGSFKWDIGLPVGIGVIVGGVIGAFLLKKLSANWVNILFIIVMLFAGGKMLFF
ncbi:MAG: sulfite exporter TauE/SafE family protein [Clostridia bacterium]|nr:sulfite exporter TauE/SafE family protein [Clostridia bacterium]